MTEGRGSGNPKGGMRAGVIRPVATRGDSVGEGRGFGSPGAAVLEEANRLLGALGRKGLSLAVAESCSGGMLGAAVTAVPGASDVFVGGVVAYSNQVKESLVGVSAAALEGDGAVSRAVAEQMSEGVRGVTRADVGIAITGIAGPGGGTSEKPVGTVWISVAAPAGTVTESRHFHGSRDDVREASVDAALRLARRSAEAGQLHEESLRASSTRNH